LIQCGKNNNLRIFNKIFYRYYKYRKSKGSRKSRVIDGVTFIPTFLAKKERDAKEILHAVCELVEGPAKPEVNCLDYKGMVR